MNNATRILVVDDTPAILQVYSEILRADGYEVLEASTGQEGLHVTREKRPGLVLLDVILPDLSGMEVCRQIKADTALSDVFVVLFSGEATDAAHKVSGLTAGADDYIARPVAPHEFLARVRTILRLRETTAALRASEQHYRRLVEILPDAVGLIDLTGRLLAANPQAVAMLGYAHPGELLEKTVFDLAPREEQERIRADIATALETGILKNAEYTLLRKDGHRFPVESSAAVSTDLDGQTRGLVLLARDITERKRTEEQVRLLADAMQSAQELICITDAENGFTFANRAFLQTYGYTAEEIMGRKPDILYSAKNAPGLCEEVFQQTLRGGWRGEIVNCRKDGTEFPISLSTSQIRNSEGRTLGLIGVARDISERRRAERQSAAFAQLGYRLSGASTREQAAQVILDIGSELFGWDAGYVNLYSPIEDKAVPLLTVDTLAGERVLIAPPSAPLEPTPQMRRVMEEGAQLVSRSGESAEALNLVPFGDVNRRSASLMFVPIHASGAIIGVLSIQSYRPLAYSQEDLKLLQTLADHCGDALQRIEMADLLREAEAKYRGIFENATEGIFQTTPAGRFRSANPALARMLGYPSREELIANVTDIERQLYVKPERRQESRRLLEAQGSVQGSEFELLRKDGSTIWVSINGRVVRDGSGTVLYYEGTIQDITQRKLAEEALQMGQILQASLLDNILDPAWLKDAEGRFLACNEPLERLLGRTRQRIVGRTFFDLVPEAAAQVTAEDNQVMRSGKPASFEGRLIDNQGRVRWFETIKSPLFSRLGVAKGTVGIARDITERRWVENLLRVQRDFGIFLSSTGDLRKAAEQLLKVALENEGLDCGAVYLLSPETGALDLSVHHGLSADFAKRASHFAARPPRDRLAGGEQGSAQPQVGPMAGIVVQLQREGLRALAPIPIQEGGQVVAVLNVGSRVCAEIPAKTHQAIEALATQAGGAIARIRAEQSLRTHQQLLQKTLDSLYVAVFIVDAPTTTIRECNPAATRIFGYSREEIIGQTPSLLHVNEARREEFRRRLEAAIKEKGYLGEFEYTMRRKDGSSFPSVSHLVPIRNEAGQIVTWVGVIRDISERKRTEEDLRDLTRRLFEAQEAERQRVARELHDSVNQLIASAKMRLQKVEDHVVLNPVARELLARCSELLVQALEENRHIAHNLRPSDLDTLGLGETCRNFCRQFQSRTHLLVKSRITRVPERYPPAVELNLFRIVQEAFNNVEKHARAKTLRLRLALERGTVLLKIQDDGRGFSAHASQTAKRKGHGIGLTNIRERATILRGSCEIASGPNQGTTITVRVPLSRPQDH